MPVRSLSSSVIVWPKSDEVVKALKVEPFPFQWIFSYTPWMNERH